MITKYDIQQEQLDIIVARDKDCVYCHKTMISPYDIAHRSDSVTIEHLNHRSDWYSVQDFNSKNLPVYPIVAICCGACNSSRGSKPLLKWFKTDYCQKWNINLDTVSEVVRDYANKYEKSSV